MKRRWLWGLSSLILALDHGTLSAQESNIPASPFSGASNPAFTRWGGVPTSRPKPPPPPPSSVAAKNRASDTAAAHRAQEEANFLRRMAVCDKLRELALATGDDDLERKAESLQQKAESAYKERTTNLAPGNAVDQTDDKPRGSKR